MPSPLQSPSKPQAPVELDMLQRRLARWWWQSAPTQRVDTSGAAPDVCDTHALTAHEATTLYHHQIASRLLESAREDVPILRFACGDDFVQTTLTAFLQDEPITTHDLYSLTAGFADYLARTAAAPGGNVRWDDQLVTLTHDDVVALARLDYALVRARSCAHPPALALTDDARSLRGLRLAAGTTRVALTGTAAHVARAALAGTNVAWQAAQPTTVDTGESPPCDDALPLTILISPGPDAPHVGVLGDAEATELERLLAAASLVAWSTVTTAAPVQLTTWFARWHAHRWLAWKEPSL